MILSLGLFLLMRPQCSHITRKRGSIYYYRRRLPRPHSGDVALSLGTNHFREAEYLAKVLDYIFDSFFKDEAELTDIKAILREQLRAALEADRQHHLNTPPRRPVYSLDVGQYEDPVDVDTEVVHHLLDDAREAKARRDPQSIQAQLDNLMRTKGISEEHRTELGLGLLQVQVQMFEQALVNLKGGTVSQVDLGPVAAPAAVPLVQTEPVDNSELFSVAVEAYITYGLNRKGWKNQSLSQSRMVYRGFVEICGDLPVQQYEHAHLTKFYDLLQELPSLWSKSPEWRDMSLRDIAKAVKGGNHKLLTMKTISRYFSSLSGFFDYLKSRGEFDGENPARGFKFPNNKRLNENRDMWKGENLRRLLSSPIWAGSLSEHRRSLPGTVIIEDAKYWLPLLALYHGNRLEECAQLRREDIQEEDGIWFMNITDEGERQTKSMASNRRVPLHPRIEELGFLDYVRRVSVTADDRIFPKLRAGGSDKKYGHGYTKGFTKYRKDIGVYERGLDYHSFRGGVVTKLYAAGVPEEHIDELCGYAGGGTGRRVYKKTPLPLKLLKEAISKVEWPEDTVKPPRQSD